MPSSLGGGAAREGENFGGGGLGGGDFGLFEWAGLRGDEVVCSSMASSMLFSE